MGRPKKEKPNRADGRYEYKLAVGKKIDGTVIRKSFYSYESKEDAKKQAEEWHINQEVAKRSGVNISSSSMTFDKWAVKWLETVKGTVKDSTFHLTYYNYTANHLIPYFGNYPLTQIKASDIKTFFIKKSESLSYESLKKVKQCLNQLYEAAIDDDICFKNPCKNIKLTDTGSTVTKRIYTAEQISFVLNYAKTHRYGLEISFLLLYGLRRGELLGLMWEDVDYQNKVLKVRRAVSNVQDVNTKAMKVVIDPPKTKYSIRDIPIAETTLHELEERKENMKLNRIPQSPYIFPNQFGEVCDPDTWSDRHYKVFMEQMHDFYINKDPPVDIPKLNAHELRHTRTSLWVNDGKNLFAIAEVLGWGDLKMLRKRYAHGDIQSLRKDLGL